MRVLAPRVGPGLALCLLQLAHAVPNVTVVPLPSTCASYPGYDNSTDVAEASWLAVADSTGNAIDGNGVTAAFFTDFDGDHWGFVTIPVTKPTTNTTMRCTNNTLQAYLNTSSEETLWEDIVVSSDPNWEDGMGYGFPAKGPPDRAVEPYRHSVNGTQQPGIFLGLGNITTWLFKYNWAGNAGEYYLLRLLGPLSDIAEGDVTGFLKIND
ncbi:hypothetical protein BJ170DRAFT_715491 [Xylariales sp. AK1849]|nr:hypothetical protein BJ170DRAFT_715491 [Xylariales sp. AK1849]